MDILENSLHIPDFFSYIYTFNFSKYNVRRTTSNLKIPYHVKESFRTEFTGSLRRLESSIEEEYLHSLRQNCFREKSYSK